MNLKDIFKKFPERYDCIRFLEKIYWPKEIKCRKCTGTDNYRMQVQVRHYCRICKNQFSVTYGTIFHQHSIPLQYLFLAIPLILEKPKKRIAILSTKLNLNPISVRKLIRRILTHPDQKTLKKISHEIYRNILRESNRTTSKPFRLLSHSK